MTVRSQLHACADALMAGVRASERVAEPNPRVLATLRACLDVVERLEHASADVTVLQVEIALGVLKQAVVDLGRAQGVPNAVLGSVRNAFDRMQRLQGELGT